MSISCRAVGISKTNEKIYSNRMVNVPEASPLTTAEAVSETMPNQSVKESPTRNMRTIAIPTRLTTAPAPRNELILLARPITKIPAKVGKM